MSMLLMAKAMSLKVGNPVRKLVLLKLADNANDKGICFPSYQHIADQCEITKRCAINHINALIAMKFLRKQQRKNDDQNSSNIYILTLESYPQGSAGNSPCDEPDSLGSELGSLGGSELGSPITSHSFEPVNEPKKTTQKSAVALLQDFGIEGQLAADFITHRKTKRAAITLSALNAFQREAAKAGISIQRAVEISIERNWQGFKADWDWRDNPPNRNSGQAKPLIMDTKSTGWSKGMKLRIHGEEVIL